jgi:hypothetical protein
LPIGAKVPACLSKAVKRPGPRSTLQASEIGTYVFCQRAWWFQRQGVEQDASGATESGLAWHRRHGRRVLTAGIIRLVGWALLLAAVVAAAAYLAPIVFS